MMTVHIEMRHNI